MRANTSFLVLAVELDSGTLFLADRSGAVGTDALLPAVLSFGQASVGGAALTLEAQALPDYVYPSSPFATSGASGQAGEYWTNRAAMLLEVEPGAGSVYDGRTVFDGVFAAEPSEQAGVLTLNLIPHRNKVVTLPGYGVIDAAAYPSAPAASQGAHKPLVFGTVEDCPLIPVALPESTTLSVAASAGDAQLEVADATLLAATGSVVVDGHTYTYTAKSGNILLGVAVLGDHRVGTMVAQAGSAVFLAAGHALASLGNIKAGKTILQGATVDLAAATVTFATLPGLPVSAQRNNVSLQFDAVGAGNTALNAENAIRFAAAQASANATALPGAVRADTDPQVSVISFARPSGRIVRGVYTVGFTVAVGAQIGWARVKIGGDVVWQMEAPASVIYNYAPATILLDTDVDVLPVAVEVEQGGSTDQVSVTIGSASRVVYTGNLDDANYATLRQASNNTFRADQLTANPDLGTIISARLVVRWFAAKSGMGVPTVNFSSRQLGVLAQTQLANNSLSQNISVDVTSQGIASLPQQNISTTVGGGTASLSHASIAQRQTVNAAFGPVILFGGTWHRQRGFALSPKLTGWTSGAITVYCMMRGPSGAQPNDDGGITHADLRRSDGTIIAVLSGPNLTWTNVATEMWQGSMFIYEEPASIFFEQVDYGSPDSANSIISVSFVYNAQLTNGAITQNNTAASGSSAPISAQSLGHSGTAVGVTGGNISFTVPAPPRVINTVFDLAEYTDWAQFTGKQIEINYAGGTGVDLCVVQVYLSVEYDAITYAAVGGSGAPLAATVTGLSGNPADVLAWLLQASGNRQHVEASARARLAAWCQANSVAFARRIAEPTDALSLLSFAADQICAVLCDTPDGMRMLRWFDLAEAAAVIDPADLLSAARIGWADRAENAITLNYRADYAGNLSAARTGGSPGSFSRTRVASSTTDSNCRMGLANAGGETRAITLDGGWLRTDASATIYLAAYARRHARPRKVLALQLPFTYAGLTVGTLTEYDGITARITALNDDNGWLDISAEEILI